MVLFVTKALFGKSIRENRLRLESHITNPPRILLDCTSTAQDFSSPQSCACSQFFPRHGINSTDDAARPGTHPEGARFTDLSNPSIRHRSDARDRCEIISEAEDLLQRQHSCALFRFPCLFREALVLYGGIHTQDR